MAARNSTSPYRLRSLVTLLYRYRVPSVDSGLRHCCYMQPCNLGNSCCRDQGLRFISASSRAYSQPKLEMVNIQDNQLVQPPSPAPSNSSFSNWVKWLLGSVLPLLLSLWKTNWNGFWSLEGKAEKVVEEVEDVAEVIEKVATTADKTLATVADWLPDESKLKEAALMAENVSSITAKDALCAQNLIHKVEDLKQDLEDLETMVEPVVRKIIDKK
ncbi:uncharacterized protein LOC111379334 [Olea europaea var. sylvestris]|uniref:uncharacterized protein LOC111379334 n=1 Tax=Olea europaea var. sylvestris TaxID=158386 RepID=UPI000C1CD6D7|nr:uncharacterized protein LOC111379334 [Olea europaea var. sylvestris]